MVRYGERKASRFPTLESRSSVVDEDEASLIILPPVSIIPKQASQIVLDEINWPERLSNHLAVAIDRRPEIIELTVDDMRFFVRCHSSAQTQAMVSQAVFTNLFGDKINADSSSFSISLGAETKINRHRTLTNQTLLLLSQKIGQAVLAANVAWLPSGVNVGFPFFEEALADYISDDLFPALLQVRYSELTDNKLRTVGLNYFAGQELEIQLPIGYPISKAVKILLRIVVDIVTNGRVNQDLYVDGLNADEKLYLRPTADHRLVMIELSKSSPIN